MIVLSNIFHIPAGKLALFGIYGKDTNTGHEHTAWESPHVKYELPDDDRRYADQTHLTATVKSTDLGMSAFHDTLVHDVGVDPEDIAGYASVVEEVISRYGVLVPVPVAADSLSDYGKGGNNSLASALTPEVIEKVGDHALSYACELGVPVVLWMNGDWVEDYTGCL